MKKQTNRILVSLLIVGFISLGIGYSADLPHNNRNNSARYTLHRNLTESAITLPPQCPSVTAGDILREINNSPPSLKQQFRDGTITYSFAEQTKTLIFKGYIHGNGNNLRSLVSGFDKLRGEQCLRVISFEGETTGSNFEWRADLSSADTEPLKDCDVGGVIERVFGNQINNTLFYDYDKTSRILELRGHFGDAPGKGRFNSLTAQLQKYMKNGCLAKIAFVPKSNVKGTTSTQLLKFNENNCKTESAFAVTKIAFVPETRVLEKLLLNRGFEWQICEYPSCECAGHCQPCSNVC